MSFPQPQTINDINQLFTGNSDYDALILISPNGIIEGQTVLNDIVAQAAQIDARVNKEDVLLHVDICPGHRLILAATGDLTADYDDVRNVGDAAKRGIEIAKQAGATKPAIVVAGLPNNATFDNALSVAYLSACQGLWKPLEAREIIGEGKLEPIECIGLAAPNHKTDIDLLAALETGKRLARDLCGTEPERMAPPKFAEYCQQAFIGDAVTITVESDRATLERKYPLLAAVARASQSVERHQPRVIHLEYVGEGPIEQTIMLTGKAVTYDTGGADLKVGGHMAGMSRDKGGAAAVAGFVKTIAMLKP
ncbi:MAG: hypothetical protein V2I33_09970, partial [Kangiellaceae bacterium]|nr:hypothetical protein [Kangiellaceae bacterium]